jgi:hypothetical protein
VAAVAIIAVATAAWLRVRAPEPAAPASASADLYTASDSGLVGSTGRPQLVEFFHPG